MKRILANLSLRQRITIALVIALAGVGVYELIQYQQEADFRPLFTGVAPEDAGGIVQKLKESGVEYRLGERNGSILVPSARLAELRRTLRGRMQASPLMDAPRFARNVESAYREMWKHFISSPL